MRKRKKWVFSKIGRCFHCGGTDSVVYRCYLDTGKYGVDNHVVEHFDDFVNEYDRHTETHQLCKNCIVELTRYSDLVPVVNGITDWSILKKDGVINFKEFIDGINTTGNFDRNWAQLYKSGVITKQEFEQGYPPKKTITGRHICARELRPRRVIR